MKKIVITSILALVLSLIPASAFAVEYGGVGGRPANPREDNPRSQSIFIYELKPGDAYEDAVQVFNNTTDRRTIELHAVDSIAASDGAFACAQNMENKVDVGQWITLDKSSVTLDAGQDETVGFKIQVPDNASVGEHGGCIAMQDANKGDTQTQGGVVLTFRSAIRVAVTIPGDIVKALDVREVSLIRNEQNDKQYTIRPSVVNTGNVSLDTDLKIELATLFGTSIETKNATYPVLPRSPASWNFDFGRPFWGGWYKANVTATYNNNVADSLGEAASGELVSTSKSSGYVFIDPSPLALVIELLVIVGLAILAALGIRKLQHRRHVRHHWKHYTVQEGDSLQKIAKHYGVSWKKLASSNHVRAPYHLEVGSKLKVPPKKSG